MIWWILWLGAALALLAIELLVPDLVSIWFALASLLVCIVTAIFPGLHWGWQVLIFAATSVILLILTRPFVRNFLRKGKTQKTNLDLIIDHVGIVEEDIDNDLGKGAVKINGLVWNGRSVGGENIPKGTLVIVHSIDGNKLIVTKKQQEEK